MPRFLTQHPSEGASSLDMHDHANALLQPPSADQVLLVAWPIAVHEAIALGIAPPWLVVKLQGFLHRERCHAQTCGQTHSLLALVAAETASYCLTNSAADWQTGGDSRCT